jgi:hypothetical protein
MQLLLETVVDADRDLPARRVHSAGWNLVVVVVMPAAVRMERAVGALVLAVSALEVAVHGAGSP